MKRISLIVMLIVGSSSLMAQNTNDLWLLELSLQNSLRQSEGFLSHFTPQQSQSIQNLYFQMDPNSTYNFTVGGYNNMLAEMVLSDIPPKSDLHPLVQLLGIFVVQSAYNSYVLHDNPYTFVNMRYRNQYRINPDIGLRDFGGYTKPNMIGEPQQ